MAVTKQQLIDWALKHDFRMDKWGHFQKQYDDRTYRLKLSSIAVRYEVKSVIFNTWIRLHSNYYKDVTITEEGKLSGLKR